MRHLPKVSRQLLIFEVAELDIYTHTHTPSQELSEEHTHFVDILGSFHLFSTLVQAHTHTQAPSDANAPLW